MVTDKVLPSSATESGIAAKAREQRVQDSRTRGSPHPAFPQPDRQQHDYADLKRLIMQQGLLDKQLGY